MIDKSLECSTLVCPAMVAILTGPLSTLQRAHTLVQLHVIRIRLSALLQRANNHDTVMPATAD